MNFWKLALQVTDQYRESLARGFTEAYMEGAQIARLGLSLELCQHAEGSAECTDWRRGYFNELGKGKR